MNDLEARVSRLERSNRLYRFGLLATLFACAALFALGAGRGQQVQEVVKAKAIQVVNDQGKVLAAIEEFQGNGSVTTYNANGKILTDIVATQSGSGGVVVYNGNGAKNILLTDTKGGGGSLRVNNAEGNSAFVVAINERGAGSTNVYNKAGRSIVLSTGDTSDGGAVLTYNSEGGQSDRMPH